MNFVYDNSVFYFSRYYRYFTDNAPADVALLPKRKESPQ